MTETTLGEGSTRFLIGGKLHLGDCPLARHSSYPIPPPLRRNSQHKVAKCLYEKFNLARSFIFLFCHFLLLFFFSLSALSISFLSLRPWEVSVNEMAREVRLDLWGQLRTRVTSYLSQHLEDEKKKLSKRPSVIIVGFFFVELCPL